MIPRSGSVYAFIPPILNAPGGLPKNTGRIGVYQPPYQQRFAPAFRRSQRFRLRARTVRIRVVRVRQRQNLLAEINKPRAASGGIGFALEPINGSICLRRYCIYGSNHPCFSHLSFPPPSGSFLKSGSFLLCSAVRFRQFFLFFLKLPVFLGDILFVFLRTVRIRIDGRFGLDRRFGLERPQVEDLALVGMKLFRHIRIAVAAAVFPSKDGGFRQAGRAGKRRG